MFKITIQALPLTAEFEVGSIGEAIGILEEQDTHLRRMLGLSAGLHALAVASETTAISTGTVHVDGATGATADDTSSDDTAAETNGTTGKRRGRKSNAEKEAEAKAAADAAKLAEEAAAKAAAATAPEPITIPGAVAKAPDTTVGTNGVPAFLDRTSAPPAAAAPPPPPPAAAPPPPPPAPVAPPSGILAGKVIANLNLRKSGAGEEKEAQAAVGKQLADWLASENVGLVAAGSSFDDAVDAIRLMSDERLTPIAKSLEVI
jgi:hypothetical protein